MKLVAVKIFAGGGLVTLILGLIGVIRPVARLHMPTRKRAARRAMLILTALSLPTEAIAQSCDDLARKRTEAIAVVRTQSNALRECLIAFPDWRAEAQERFYDAYDVTETIPGKPRRIIISHGRYTSTAYVAPPTRTHVERSVEFEDIGMEKRLSLYTPEQRAEIYSLGSKMNVPLGDEFLLCRDKVDAVGFVQALDNLGWGFQGGLNGVQESDGWDSPLSNYNLTTCRRTAASKVDSQQDWENRRRMAHDAINRARAMRGLPPLP